MRNEEKYLTELLSCKSCLFLVFLGVYFFTIDFLLHCNSICVVFVDSFNWPMLLCFAEGICFLSMMSNFAWNEPRALMHPQCCSEDLGSLMSSLMGPDFNVATHRGSTAFAFFLLACCSLFCTAAPVCTAETAG